MALANAALAPDTVEATDPLKSVLDQRPVCQAGW